MIKFFDVIKLINLWLESYRIEWKIEKIEFNFFVKLYGYYLIKFLNYISFIL